MEKVTPFMNTQFFSCHIYIYIYHIVHVFTYIFVRIPKFITTIISAYYLMDSPLSQNGFLRRYSYQLNNFNISSEEPVACMWMYIILASPHSTYLLHLLLQILFYLLLQFQSWSENLKAQVLFDVSLPHECLLF